MENFSSSHFSSKSQPSHAYHFSITKNFPKSISERMPTCSNLSKKPILREGHLSSTYLDHHLDITIGLERQGWTTYALKEFEVYEPLVRWFYKYVNIETSEKGYSSIATWSVDVVKDGQTIGFYYDSSKLQRDFNMLQYGFGDISLVSEKSHKWKPTVDKLIAQASGKNVDVSFEEELSARLVQTIFMPTTFFNCYQQNAQFTIASKLLIQEPINLPVIMAKHMSMAQCDPDIPTIPYGGLVTHIMRQWLLIRPFGIKRESFFFGSDIFDDQWKLIKEHMLKDDFPYESEKSDEDEEEADDDPEMESDEPKEIKEVVVEADTSDEEDGALASYTVEERLDLLHTQTQRRYKRVRTEMASIREVLFEGILEPFMGYVKKNP